MDSELCPNCGTALTGTLRFCVNCRRTVTEDKPKGSAHSEGKVSDRFRLSRKSSYDDLRQARTAFTMTSTLLAIIFVYYFVMKFVIHQPIPFESNVSTLIDQVQRHGIQSIGQTKTQETPQTDSTQTSQSDSTQTSQSGSTQTTQSAGTSKHHKSKKH